MLCALLLLLLSQGHDLAAKKEKNRTICAMKIKKRLACRGWKADRNRGG